MYKCHLNSCVNSENTGSESQMIEPSTINAAKHKNDGIMSQRGAQNVEKAKIN